MDEHPRTRVGTTLASMYNTDNCSHGCHIIQRSRMRNGGTRYENPDENSSLDLTGNAGRDGAHWVNAQNLDGMTTRDMLLKIRTANVDQMNQIVRTMDRNQMARLAQSMDSATMSEIVRSLDPSTMAEVARRILIDFAQVEPESVVATSRICKNRLLRGRTGNQTAEARPASLERRNRCPDGQELEGIQEEQMNLAGVAIITHPSNPVYELTLEQIRKIYTGEYDNWSQVGGPDQQIKVIAVGEMPGVHLRLTSNASVSAFASDVFMGVASAGGAIGFVPQMQRRQLRFIERHEAVRIMAVRIPILIKGVGTAHSS